MISRIHFILQSRDAEVRYLHSYFYNGTLYEGIKRAGKFLSVNQPNKWQDSYIFFFSIIICWNLLHKIHIKRRWSEPISREKSFAKIFRFITVITSIYTCPAWFLHGPEFALQTGHTLISDIMCYGLSRKSFSCIHATPQLCRQLVESLTFIVTIAIGM